MKYILVLLLTLNFSLALAQTNVSGKITSKGKPIAGVNISIKDSYDGATSNDEGFYSFETTETGEQTLLFQHPKYEDVQKTIQLGNSPLSVNADLKAQINEIDAVVITAGAIEASDKKRATALLSPIDIYTTAGSDGQITKALEYLPGTQKVGETEGLFIRGGTGSEAKIFIDGSLVNNYFSNSVPGIAGRDRFNTSLFKGNIFSSGGYSALYGQALSGVLILESVDLPDQSSYDFGISPIFLSGGVQKLSQDKTYSYGISASYSLLDLMQKIFNFNTHFTKAPESFNGDANFRIKTKNGGMIKYYGMFDTNKMGVQSESLEPDYDFSNVFLKAKNTFHSLSYRQKFGKYTFNSAASLSYNHSDMDLSTETENIEKPTGRLSNTGNYINFKTFLERKINRISAVRGGIELNNANEIYKYYNFARKYVDLNSAVFLETDLGFSNHLSAKFGVRAENSSYFSQSSIAPRIALAYRLSKDWTTSVAYGIFYQSPESKYLNYPAALGFQKADHYIFQLQRSSEGRSLRFEAFYKNYDELIKTSGNNFFQTAVNNDGKGYAKGLEIFWRDKKTFKNIDYWISYSYLDSKRDFMNYPFQLQPSFASKHTLSAVAKKFVMEWKTGFNLSYTYAKGRPYYDIISPEGENINFIRNQGRLKDYNALNFSVNYLPNLGKKDSKAFTVLVLSVSNILGNKNIYGYNFSNDGLRSSAVVPPVNTFVFVGAFISFGVDKTQDAINNNL